MPLEQLILMPEPMARRALSGKSIALRVLAPVGAYAGRGALRVLRIRAIDEAVELDCGYESYQRLDDATVR
jgi:hypothetical protein